LASQVDVDSFVGLAGTKALAFVSGDNEAIWLQAAANEKVQAFSFAHATSASLFGGNAEGTVQLIKDGEETKTYSGAFVAKDIANWVASEGFPLVDELSQESWTRAQSSTTDLLAVFAEKTDSVAAAAALAVAKDHKGTLVVTSSDQITIASRWGASGNVIPTVIYVHNNNGAQPTFTVWNEDNQVALNAENLKAFVTGAQAGSYESWIKSEPIPENNNGPVIVVVGKSFDDVVLQKKDVLVEFYAPWCGHCKKLAPVWDELGEAYKADDNVVIAKMDTTANGSPKGVSIQGFPTIILFDANNVQHPYDGERELVAFKSWLDTKRASKPSAGGDRDEL